MPKYSCSVFTPAAVLPLKMHDRQLIESYVQDGSQAAFAELVDRHLNLVYSVAWRKLGNPHDAEEISQIVLCQLARKARTLKPATDIAGWLYKAAVLESLNHLRRERRRHQREQEAGLMNLIAEDSNDSWQKIAPHLDDALMQLAEPDRLLILRRFFQRTQLNEIGRSLGLTEDAARMRINRILEKMRMLLARKGITCSSVMLGALLVNNGVQAAPLTVLKSVQSAWPPAAATTAGSSAILTLLALMAKTKLKTLAVVAFVLLLAATIGLSLFNNFRERRAARTASLPTDIPARPPDTARSARTFSHLPKPVPASQKPGIQDAIANLWRVLREEPVDAQGRLTSSTVWNAMRQFGPDGQAAIPTLLEGLKDKNTMVQQCSVWGFHFLGHDADETIPNLVQIFRSETETHYNRVMAIEALVEMGEGFSPRPPDISAISVAIPDLVSLLQDKDIGVSSAAAGALGRMGDKAKGAVPLLSQLLTYPVSLNDAKASYFNDGESVDDRARLERLIPNLDRNLKISAIDALEKIGPDAQSAVPLLNELLDYPEKQVRASSAIALWKITGQTDVASGVLADTIYPPPGPDLHVWRKQMEALAEMGPAAQAALPALQKLAKWGNEEIREPALETLNKISPSPANQMVK